LPAQVFNVLELIPDFQMTMVEVAFDFFDSLTRSSVRKHGLFGRSRPVPSVNGTDYWGTRRGSKRVQVYFKEQIHACRVELELHARFLKRYGIRSPLDFHRLVDVVPGNHIYFGTLDAQKLVRRMTYMGLSPSRQREILRMVDSLKGNLWSTLYFLREDLELKNPRRLVDDHPINEAIPNAIRSWSLMWPVRPTKLGGGQ
jgi:hypothetical protein